LGREIREGWVLKSILKPAISPTALSAGIRACRRRDFAWRYVGEKDSI
jgi:hypothetical protein